MKVLIDIVYTGRPSTCSTSYVAWKNIKAISEKWADAYFYLTFPNQWNTEEELDWVKKQEFSDRVTLIPVDKYCTDRVTDLLSFPRDILELVSPTSRVCWDADVVLSTRIPQLAMYRTNSSRSVGFGKGTFRGVFGLDDMPMLGFRNTVAWGNTGELDVHTMGQYLSSDGAVISDLWTKKKMLSLARNYFTPSTVMKLDAVVKEALPVKLSKLDLRKVYTKGDVFNVVFAGRMTGTRNFKGVAELLRKQYSFPIGKGGMKFIVTTNSRSVGSAKVGEVDFIEFQYNSREQFYALLKEQAHVVVNLSTVEDFSLSTYEPLLFGVPVIVPSRSWADFLGEDYPFRANNEVEAYALISAMANDYDAMYAKFEAWHNGTWSKLVEGKSNVSTSEVVVDMLGAHMSSVYEYISASGLGGVYREAAEKIDACGDEVVDIVSWMTANGLLEWEKKWEQIPVTKRPSLHMLKLLLNLRGYVDTETCGVVRRKK